MVKKEYQNQEQNLKKVLGTGDSFLMAVGIIIGAGVMSLTGVSIGLTGSGTIFAYLLSAVFMLIGNFSTAQLGAAAPSTGGSYKYVSRLLGAKWGFFFILFYIPTYIALSLYALSFSQYFVILFPRADVYIAAMAVMTFFYVINIIGIRSLSLVQNALVFILLAALFAFVGFGLSKVDFTEIAKRENLLPSGAAGLFKATALLSFAMVGSGYLGNLGGEMKTPNRTIPIAVLGSTVFVGILYAIIAVVACGVLPLNEVAGHPLSLVADKILPRPIFYIFIIGGALGATASTIAGTLAYVTKPLVIACQDGYLPRALGKVSKRTGVPSILLTLFYIVSMIPLIFRISLENIANFCTGVGSLAFCLPGLALFFLLKKYPELYEKSPFKLPKKIIPVMAIASFTISILQGLLLLSGFPLPLVLAVFIYGLIAIVAGIIMEKKRPIPRDLSPS